MTDRLAVNSDTRSDLGNEVVEKLRSSLLPIDCQTCGQRFEDPDGLVLAVDVLPITAFAALHHDRCRSPARRNLPDRG